MRQDPNSTAPFDPNRAKAEMGYFSLTSPKIEF